VPYRPPISFFFISISKCGVFNDTQRNLTHIIIIIIIIITIIIGRRRRRRRRRSRNRGTIGQKNTGMNMCQNQ